MLLGSELIRVLKHERLRSEIWDELELSLGERGASSLGQVVFAARNGTLLVLAEVGAPRVVKPARVAIVEAQLSERLQRDVRLNLRVMLTKNVSASGHYDEVFAASVADFTRGLGGQHPRRRIQRVEQLIREQLETKLGVYVDDVRTMSFGAAQIVVLDVSGARPLSRDEIATLQSSLREHFDGETVELKVVQDATQLRDDKGLFRAEFSMRRPWTEHERILVERAEQAALQWLTDRGFWLEGWSFSEIDNVYHMLLEVKGPRLLNQADLDALSVAVSGAAGQPLQLIVRSVPEVVLGDQAGISFETLLQRYRAKNRAAYEADTRRLLESVR